MLKGTKKKKKKQLSQKGNVYVFFFFVFFYLRINERNENTKENLKSQDHFVVGTRDHQYLYVSRFCKKVVPSESFKSNLMFQRG